MAFLTMSAAENEEKPAAKTLDGLSSRELALRLKRAHPDRFGKVPGKIVIAIVDETLRLLAREIDTTPLEVLEIEGLGRFRSRIVEKVVGNNTTLITRIQFVPAKQPPKATQERPKKAGSGGIRRPPPAGGKRSRKQDP